MGLQRNDVFFLSGACCALLYSFVFGWRKIYRVCEGGASLDEASDFGVLLESGSY